MWDISEIKARGKAAFRLNYWKCVLVSFILGIVLSSGSSISLNTSKDNTEEMQQSAQELSDMYNGLTPGQQFALLAGVSGVITLALIISFLVKIFVYNPLKVGGMSFFKDNVIDPPAGLDSIGVGFRNYLHIFITLFLNDLFLTLWTMLLIVPGIIKSYSYRMVPYILADEPDLSPTETITRSRQMMDGNKWHAFCYDLSFIGWFLLSIVTCGLVGLFWYGPYKNSSDAALYLELRDGQGFGGPDQYVTPEPPVYPTAPVEPETTVWPAEPEVPETPVEPEATVVPEEPEVPEVPAEPEAPVVPAEPDAPEVPEVPAEPEAPETPEEQ